MLTPHAVKGMKCVHRGGGGQNGFPFPRGRGKVPHHLCREESREMAAGANAQVVWRMGGALVGVLKA